MHLSVYVVGCRRDLRMGPLAKPKGKGRTLVLRGVSGHVADFGSSGSDSGAPLVTITMFVQVVAVTLLPACLVFLILLLNDESYMEST